MRHTLLLSLILFAWAAAPVGQKTSRIGRAFTSASELVLTDHSLMRMLPVARPAPLAARSIRTRGGPETYALVAPSVVVVRTDSGHGTGFIVDRTGMVITNHHVVEDGLRHDAAGGSYAMVHVGRLDNDGTMALEVTPRRAWVYKLDPSRDLALLKIEGAGSWPFLALADKAPRPGMGCAMVGHPASGMLWSIRPCQVASIGQMPSDLVDLVMTELAASDDERKSVAAQLDSMPKRRIVLTSAGANPGDSGGPLVDDGGKIIGVTFGAPADPARAKFTYHVHLDELRTFLASVPTHGMIVTPDPWQIGPRVELVDADGDGRPDLLIAGNDDPETMLFDLDNDTPRVLPGMDALLQLVADRRWDFEAAVHILDDSVTAFYDANNDGELDLIVSARENRVDRFTRPRGGEWTYKASGPADPLSPANLQNPALASRFRQLLDAFLEK